MFKNDAESISQRINTTFLDAVANIRNNKGLKVSTIKAQMYGLFKQANIGPNKAVDLECLILLGLLNDAWTACKATAKGGKYHIKLVTAVDPSVKQ